MSAEPLAAPPITPTDRTPKACPHNPAHLHGTSLAYRKDGCRCIPCLTATRLYQRRLSRDKLYGRPRLVDAAPARTHVEALRAAGMSIRGISEVAGIGSTVFALIYTRGDLPPSKKIKAGTADAILAIPMPRPADHSPSRRVPSLGAQRRVRALMRLGWTIPQIADAAGLPARRITNLLCGPEIITATHRQVIVAYNQLWDKRFTPTTPHEKGNYTRTLKIAETKGWAPPAAWDDDDLDDPAGRPHGHRPYKPRTRPAVEDADERMAG